MRNISLPTIQLRNMCKICLFVQFTNIYAVYFSNYKSQVRSGLILPFSMCLALGKLYNLSHPQLSNLKNTNVYVKKSLW